MQIVRQGNVRSLYSIGLAVHPNGQGIGKAIRARRPFARTHLKRTGLRQQIRNGLYLIFGNGPVLICWGTFALDRQAATAIQSK